MKFIRDRVDRWYDSNRDRIFGETEDDPERAHEWFVRNAQRIHRRRLEGILFNCPENNLKPRVELSNAAGFNKDGTIPPKVLKYLGFDRVVVGTVTYDPWAGNPKGEGGRIRRFVETESMVNWPGLPGVGARQVAENLDSYGWHGVPITINLMATPGKTGDALLRDLEDTMRATRKLNLVDTYQLNISCPNTHGSKGGDSRDEYQRQLDSMLYVVEENLFGSQRVELKVSPDLTKEDVASIIDVSRNHFLVLRKFVTSNTTTVHDPYYIPSSPGKGGASGNAVYRSSFRVQQMFSEYIKNKGWNNYQLRAVGGINSVDRFLERTEDPKVVGVEIFTPLIFKGPKLLRQLRAA